MDKEFLPYEQALELKELGFDEPCLGYWNIDPYLPKPTLNMVRPFDHEWCVPTPLYQQAFRFFRDRFLNGEVFSQQRPKGNFMYGFRMSGTDIIHDGFKTYEEAEVECLKVLIQISKTK